MGTPTDLAAVLEGLGKAVGQAVRSQMSSNTLTATYGWTYPPLTASDFEEHASTAAKLIKSIPDGHISPSYIDDLTSKIKQFEAQTLPNMTGNLTAAYHGYFTLVDWVRNDLSPFFRHDVSWSSVKDKDALPPDLRRRLRSLSKFLDSHEEGTRALGEKIKAIDEAHETALSLPTDANELLDIRNEISRFFKESEGDRAQISLVTQDAIETKNAIASLRDEAATLVAETEDAYRAATSRGLGLSFQTRADNLSRSAQWWVGGLAASLLVGAVIGAIRVGQLETILLDERARDGRIWQNLALTFVALAGPVWFAWIATKQIGHRFRLAEDYAYKASVAKAYEGYRKEASRLDDDFVKRLFGSILDRLSEPPIRFVEHETPGSPWAEFFGRRLRRERAHDEQRSSATDINS